jgi:hypothetical protein
MDSSTKVHAPYVNTSRTWKRDTFIYFGCNFIVMYLIKNIPMGLGHGFNSEILILLFKLKSEGLCGSG